MKFTSFFKKHIFLIVFLASPFIGTSQDMNFNVSIITQQIQRSHKQIFFSLENSIKQFMNTRRWSKDQIKPNEKIECNILITITNDIALDRFQADFQIQSRRPVYGSNYNTMLLNLFEKDIVFSYQEYQAMEYQENANVYDLTGILAYYAYIILGLDYDSFSPEGGTEYYEMAQAILNASQNIPGWRANDGNGNRNRYYLLDNLFSERFKPMRQTYYQYHRLGLDIMHKDLVKGRAEIEKSIENLRELARLLPNSMMIRQFFFVKMTEIIEIFKEATPAEKNRVYEMLVKMDPVNNAEYEKIIR
jgi:hypothetical protein